MWFQIIFNSVEACKQELKLLRLQQRTFYRRRYLEFEWLEHGRRPLIDKFIAKFAKHVALIVQNGIENQIPEKTDTIVTN